jgi:hypothetical protein
MYFCVVLMTYVCLCGADDGCRRSRRSLSAHTYRAAPVFSSPGVVVMMMMMIMMMMMMIDDDADR